MSSNFNFVDQPFDVKTESAVLMRFVESDLINHQRQSEYFLGVLVFCIGLGRIGIGVGCQGIGVVVRALEWLLGWVGMGEVVRFGWYNNRKVKIMSHKVHKVSNRQVDHTLKHIKQLQKILPVHNNKTPEKVTLPQLDPLEKTDALDQLLAPSTPDVQPWLQELEASSATLKKQQSIRREINFILGVKDEETKEAELQIQKPDNRKIAKKLQKYQPANSSFSLYLSEKKTFEKRKAEEGEQRPSLPAFRLKGLNLPPIPIPNTYRQAHQLTSRLVPKERKRATSTRNVAFISQIKHIYNLGETTSEFPGELIHKIDSATKKIDRKFEELNTKTADMMADVGNYHLEEETDRNYKNTLLSVPRWMMKKK